MTVSTAALPTFDDLRGQCYAACASLFPSAVPQTAAHREITDTACGAFARYVRRHKPRTEPECETAQRRILPRVHRRLRAAEAFDGDRPCGFIISGSVIVAAFLDWLICKALDWLWSWWHKGKAAAVNAVCSMTGLPEDDSD